MYKIFTVIVFIAILIIIFVKIILYSIECKIIFQPSKNINSLNFVHNKFRNIQIKTIDGELIDLIHYINKDNNNLIIYAHGNAGNIYGRQHFIETYKEISSIIMFDYRGYGKSTGYPTEQGLHTDILSIWNYVTNELNFLSENIILYGESLGCSVVLWLGKKLVLKNETLPRCIILQSGFYNLKELISDISHSFISFLLQSKFNNIDYIKKINNKIPIILLHSPKDEIIKIKHAYKILKNSNIKKENLLIISGYHNSPVINSDNLNKIKKLICDNKNVK